LPSDFYDVTIIGAASIGICCTGGEMCLSNFLLWQAAYGELYFTPVLWPDFGPKELEEDLLDYKQRQRRFGKLIT